METLLQDLRYGTRMLIKRPGFTVVAVLALALGIGANTAIFSIINAVLLRPLPYAAPERLVNVWSTRPSRGLTGNSVSYPDFADWRDQNDVFEYTAAYSFTDFALTGDDNPAQVRGLVVSADLFPLLGAQPAMGRGFGRDDDKNGAPLTVILSHKLWQQRYHGDPGIIGSSLTLNSRSYTVIGIMPEAFRFPLQNDAVEMWTTFAADLTPTDGDTIADQRGAHFLQVMARLKPDASIAQAQTALATVAARLSEKYPDTNTDW